MPKAKKAGFDDGADKKHRGPKKNFKLRKSDLIGAAGAEEDEEFLAHCFVDTGDLGLLQDLSDHRVIVLGRTGAGKSALLQQLARTHEDRVIQIKPSELALTYVANSTILTFFASLGVNLDPFFNLLWRHVLTVEILSRHFHQHGPVTSGNTILEWLKSLFTGTSRKDKEMAQAVKYLEDWGRTFWQETEFRVKEITKHVESQLTDQLTLEMKNKLFSLSGGSADIQKLTEDERSELVRRGQDIVSKAQVTDLQKVGTLLDSVLGDRQKQYYVLIDGLDENWVEERLRYRLIMALINAAKEFIKVKNAKTIIALRRDLIERVFRFTRDSGFQEEKYQSLYLPLAWTKQELLDILDKRVAHMVSRHYTSRRVSYTDLLPTKMRRVAIDDYIVALARRPRDTIAFFNTCILAGVDQSKLTEATLSVAEGEYSRSRLRALADEWSADYPFLLDFAKVLERMPASFKVSSLPNRIVENRALDIVAANPGSNGLLIDVARVCVEGHLGVVEFKRSLLHVFYKVGLVGIKLTPHEDASWSDEAGQAVTRIQIGDEASVTVHPAYCRSLGISGAE